MVTATLAEPIRSRPVREVEHLPVFDRVRDVSLPDAWRIRLFRQGYTRAQRAATRSSATSFYASLPAGQA